MMILVRSVSMESGDRSLIGVKHKRKQEKKESDCIQMGVVLQQGAAAGRCGGARGVWGQVRVWFCIFKTEITACVYAAGKNT